MEPETKTETVVVPEKATGDVKDTSEETISVSKKDYETMNQTLGSLKRELKDLKKAKEEAPETSKTNTKQEESALLLKLEKMSLRQAGITHEDDIDLARKTAQKWGMDIDDVLADEDFKVKLERQQTARSNENATSNVRGGASGTQAKLSTEYWTAKGRPPTPTEVPDRAARTKIVRAMMAQANGKIGKFYNS